MPGINQRAQTSAGGPQSRANPEQEVAHAVTTFAPAGSSTPTAPVTTIAGPKVCPTCGVRYPAEFNVCPRDASELGEADADADTLVGQTLGQTYTLVRVLGEGGMGRVYEARHTRLGSKRFAIKLLHPELCRHPEVLSRFQREAEAAASVRSPYVVDVYDVDRMPDGRPFIVGEFLDGRELANLLDEIGRMSVGPAVRITRQICRALAAAHAKGVIHRDMKPENVFLTGPAERPIAKVIDFGISKLRDAPGSTLTKTGMVMGTPSYMAPEQARGDKVDQRVDIYAVGAMLYCMLTGQRPFDRGDPMATLTAVLSQDPPRPTTLEPSIPASLEMVIQRAMAKMPEDRYPSMEALEADLLPWDPGEGEGPSEATPTRSLAPPRTSLHQQMRSVEMARPLIALLGSVGLVAAAAAVLTLLAAIVRLIRGAGSNLTGFEATFLVGGLVLALLTPIVLAVRHLRREVWGNSVKAVALVERLRAPVVVGLSAYGFASLLVRVLETVFVRRAVGVAWPVWDLLLSLLAVAGVAGAIALDEASRRKD